jgi:hypothetical protein
VACWLPRGARSAAGMSKTLMRRMGIEALYRLVGGRLY